ncbi:coiled-coil domain-containing protein 63 [Condylostylus longicornis]|uniref:coiled-coil domain-containing protein 63 n=1 Tax=Condylostylus longicornis TaxID=2530218 RepID=UPI00244E4941|nr:coiled-coil domain-containing protein 63 [Condylostylus longicornis]
MATEQAELDQLAENELLRLQQQLRKLNLELKSLLEDKKTLLIKQEKLIKLLQKEHENIKTEIHFIEDGVHSKKENQEEMRLLKIYDVLAEEQKKLKNEKFSIKELNGHIRKLEKEIESLRKNEVTDSIYKETIKKVKKNVVKLENRLDVVNKKSSDVLTEIFKLRESINHILQDRSHFNVMWQSMVTQFNQGKKYIMELVDQSTLAFDQREELCTKLQALKDRNETDKMLHIQEMREVQRKLEHDDKLQQFYNIKGQKRINSDLEEREIQKKIQLREEFEKQLENYNELISCIKETCKEDNLDKVASQFTTQEEENFALFNYVNELSYEVETLNETVMTLNEDIEKQKAESIEIAQKKKTEAVDYLTNMKNSFQKDYEESTNRRQTIDNELNLLLEGIEDLFKLIQCEDIPILNVLSAKHFISVHNAKLFLGIIDRRINGLISNINTEDISTKILSKKDRIPKFNIKDSVKGKS